MRTQSATVPPQSPGFAACVCPVQAWSLLSLFVAVICGFVLSPLPSGAWAILGASVGLLTHTLSFQDMFAAANNTVVWLVVISFFLAKVSVQGGY